ncbi:MAG: glycoside hydrolase family 16 protein [Prevotellaceae bacterium]|jgi:beta-glucanase (GH16 family)|nr:glycoside hydrolase family 16 protein [Prevotellaceae bacterium]
MKKIYYILLLGLLVATVSCVSCVKKDKSSGASQPPIKEVEEEEDPDAGKTYQLVWSDEFDYEGLPDNQKWWYETGANGWGNNELQNYVSGANGTDTCALVSNGTLKIIAKKQGNQVISVRMNTHESWLYGVFEARLKLPIGKGTWPAFWMLPKNFQSWPADGEIDIMEEVGYRPNYISSSIHCLAYYHKVGTQKTAEKYIATAQSEFHVYKVEWTRSYIYGYVDGVRYFTFPNDKKNNKDTWPFNAPFYLKLNLAWGGDWGGAQGVDETALPATYEVDYVRVYQKQ